MLTKINQSDLKLAAEIIKKRVIGYENFTHFKSAVTTCAIFLKRKNKDIHFLGKPFGFYGYFAAFFQELNIIKELKELETTKGVLTSENLKEILHNLLFKDSTRTSDILDDAFNDYVINQVLNNIKYVSPTLFSTLNIAISFAEEKIDQNFIVFLPDSYIDAGEFWEGMNYLKSKKLDNLEIVIDFNSTTKQNRLPYTAEEIEDILLNFHQDVSIFDTSEINNLQGLT